MRMTWAIVAVAAALPVPSPAAGLEYGRPYACNGERFIVYYCRGDDDGPLYGVTAPVNNYCKVTYIDRPRVNGFLPETAELRGDIIQRLAACGALQAAGVPQAAPQAAPQTAPPAGTAQSARDRSTALLKAANEHFRRKEYDQGFAAAREYLRLNPTDAVAHAELGNQYLVLGRYKEAEPLVRRALQLKPDDEWAMVYLAAVNEKLGRDPKETLALLKKVVAKPNAAGWPLLDAGKRLHNLEQYDLAMTAFRACLARSKEPPATHAEAWYHVGSIELHAKRHTQAVSALQQAVRLKPDHSEAHMLMATSLEGLGRLPEATAALKNAVRLAPDDGWKLLFLGKLYQKQKQVAPARDAFRRATASRDAATDVDLLSILADKFVELNDINAALALHERALAIPSDGTAGGMESKMMSDLTTCLGISDLLLEHKRHSDYLRLFAPPGPCEYAAEPTDLATIYRETGQPGKAILVFEAAVAEDAKARAIQTPEANASSKRRHVANLLELGRMYLLAGRKPDAHRIYRMLRPIDQPKANELLAEINAAR